MRLYGNVDHRAINMHVMRSDLTHMEGGNRMSVVEMSMLRWMCGKTSRRDKIRRDTVREMVGVGTYRGEIEGK